MLRLQNSNEYEKYSFQCEIIDEAQFIKNANTQAAKAVKEIQTGVDRNTGGKSSQ